MTRLAPRRVNFKKFGCMLLCHVVYKDAWHMAGTHQKPKAIKKVWAGGYSSFAQDTDGKLWVWGPNNYGQCGVESDKGKCVCIVSPHLLVL